MALGVPKRTQCIWDQLYDPCGTHCKLFARNSCFSLFTLPQPSRALPPFSLTHWLSTARSEASRGQLVISQGLIHRKEQWRRKLQMLSAMFCFCFFTLSPSPPLTFPAPCLSFSSHSSPFSLSAFLRAAAQTPANKVRRSPFMAAMDAPPFKLAPRCS